MRAQCRLKKAILGMEVSWMEYREMESAPSAGVAHSRAEWTQDNPGSQRRSARIMEWDEIGQ